MSPGLPAGELTDRMLSYIPEERMRDGMIKEFTIAENMILREHHKAPYLARRLPQPACDLPLYR